MLIEMFNTIAAPNLALKKRPMKAGKAVARRV